MQPLTWVLLIICTNCSERLTPCQQDSLWGAVPVQVTCCISWQISVFRKGPLRWKAVIQHQVSKQKKQQQQPDRSSQNVMYNWKSCEYSWFFFFHLTQSRLRALRKTLIKAGRPELREKNYKMEDRRRQDGGPSDAATRTLLVTCQIAIKTLYFVRSLSMCYFFIF